DNERYGFSRFASHPFFGEVDRWLVERVASLGHRFVDLACGPGAVTELLLQRLMERGRGLIYAVDPSLSELELARRRVASGLVEFIQGSAENLSRLVPQVDVVVFCNAIHLIKDKCQVLSEIRKVLGAGGTLAFNTTFFKGCYPPGTERFYRYWILRAASPGSGCSSSPGRRPRLPRRFTGVCRPPAQACPHPAPRSAIIPSSPTPHSHPLIRGQVAQAATAVKIRAAGPPGGADRSD